MIDTTSPEFIELRRKLDALERRFPGLQSYRLDKETHNVVKCSFLDAVVGAVNDPTNIVERTVISDEPPILVSTAFLGPLMLAKTADPARLFETMIFGGEHDGRQFRTETWDAAKSMHQVALALVQAGDKK